MGLFDTFVDGNKAVQLKNFDPGLSTYRVGDKIPTENFGYPASCSFVCFTQPTECVVVRNGVFKGITTGPSSEIEYPVFDCSGTLVATTAPQLLRYMKRMSKHANQLGRLIPASKFRVKPKHRIMKKRSATVARNNAG
jgi:hypothetical protein